MVRPPSSNSDAQGTRVSSAGVYRSTTAAESAGIKRIALSFRVVGADIATMIEASGFGFSCDIATVSSTEEERFSPDRMCRASLMVAEAGNAA